MKVKYVFVVGCPRSGTTWFAKSLGKYTNVKVGHESEIFSYVEGLIKRFETNKKIDFVRFRNRGLINYVDDHKFYDLVEMFVIKSLNNIIDEPGFEGYLVEKTPQHFQHISTILKLIPESKIIFLIRNPMSVLRSIHLASKSWGADWAKPGVSYSLRRWLDSYNAYMRYKEVVYLVKYEDAIENGHSDELLGYLGWRNLKQNDSLVRITIGGWSKKSLSQNKEEPDGFNFNSLSLNKFFPFGWITLKDLKLFIVVQKRAKEFGYNLEWRMLFWR